MFQGVCFDENQLQFIFQVENQQHYCATGFPMGCYVDKQNEAKVTVIFWYLVKGCKMNII